MHCFKCCLIVVKMIYKGMHTVSLGPTIQTFFSASDRRASACREPKFSHDVSLSCLIHSELFRNCFGTVSIFSSVLLTFYQDTIISIFSKFQNGVESKRKVGFQFSFQIRNPEKISNNKFEDIFCWPTFSTLYLKTRSKYLLTAKS